MKDWQWRGVIGLLLLITIVVLFVDYIRVESAEMRGFCEGKGYDGYDAIQTEWCCYQWQDGSFVAVPIEMLRSE